MKVQHLYRHYDKENTLLYVGISLSAINRLGQHEDHAHWFNLISRVDIETYSTREEVRSAEIVAINKEKPLYNLQRPSLKEEKTLYQEAKDELVKRIVKFNVMYTVEEAASVLGVRRSSVIAEMGKGALSFIELEGRIRSNVPNPKKLIRITGWQLIDFIEQLERKGKKK